MTTKASEFEGFGEEARPEGRRPRHSAASAAASTEGVQGRSHQLKYDHVITTVKQLIL